MDKRIIFAMVGGALCLQPAFADTRDDVLAGMQRCRAIADDRTWLDCTYGAQQLMRSKLGLAPAPEYQQKLVPPAVILPPSLATAPPKVATPPEPHRRAGFFQVLTGTASPIAVSTLASFAYDSQGAFVVTLQNGQVWRQVEAESGSRVKLRVGAKITITPGAMWSYGLKTEDAARSYKVERKT